MEDKKLRQQLHLVSKKGGPPTISKDVGNVAQILKNSRYWQGCLSLDVAKSTIVWTVAPPIVDGFDPIDEMQIFEEHHCTLIQHWFLTQCRVSIERSMILQAVEYVANESQINTLQANIISSVMAINNSQDDAIGICKNWAKIVLDCDNSNENNVMACRWLVAAVARAFSPGVKFDHMLILEGEQGVKKSSVFEALATPEFFQDSILDIKSKDAAQQLLGSWMVEIAELTAFKKQEIEYIKAFITRKTDKIRLPYGRYVTEHPRQCVFAGTTNDEQYLSDPTGARRFWPIKVGAINIELLHKLRDHIIGGAYLLFKQGEKHWIDTGDNIDLDAIQESRYINDPWEEVIADYIVGLESVTTNEVMSDALKIYERDMTKTNQMRVGNILRRLGMERKRVRVNGNVQWRYTKP